MQKEIQSAIYRSNHEDKLTEIIDFENSRGNKKALTMNFLQLISPLQNGLTPMAYACQCKSEHALESIVDYLEAFLENYDEDSFKK
jgi:hypothetical protein